LDKRKTGSLLGMGSLLPVIVSVIYFFTQRGLHADIYQVIIVLGILSAIGILLAVFSWALTRRLSFFIIGLIGNGIVIYCTFFLLLAMGISER